MEPQAKPGPHPHEASDIRRNAGMVAQWSDPMEGFKDEDQPAETEDQLQG